MSAASLPPALGPGGTVARYRSSRDASGRGTRRRGRESGASCVPPREVIPIPDRPRATRAGRLLDSIPGSNRFVVFFLSYAFPSRNAWYTDPSGLKRCETRHRIPIQRTIPSRVGRYTRSCAVVTETRGTTSSAFDSRYGTHPSTARSGPSSGPRADASTASRGGST